MEIEIATRTCKDEAGRNHRFHYFLTVEAVESGRLFCEDYGVRIQEEEGDNTAVPSITTSATRIDELMTLLVDHKVGPAGLMDVISDWL